jgi:hypothetical protein
MSGAEQMADTKPQPKPRSRLHNHSSNESAYPLIADMEADIAERQRTAEGGRSHLGKRSRLPPTAQLM